MERRIQELVDELHCVVLFGELNCDGCVSFPPELNQPVIYVNCQLPEPAQKMVILHELGHVAKQQGEQSLYHATMAMHLQMEHSANRFAIQELYDSYLQDCDDPRHVDYLDFMRQNAIPNRDVDIVREVVSTTKKPATPLVV